MSREVSHSSSEAMAKFKKRHKFIQSEEGRLKGLNFCPSPTDVIISTPPKCGTTWAQQIMHGLRSRGNMDFDELNDVMPFLELFHDCGYVDLHQDQGYLPKMYKTHAWYPHCPKNAGKYVIVVRNPTDALVSFYKFFNGWFFEKDEIALDDFILEFCCGRGIPTEKMQNASIWHHLISWYPHRMDKNVLWLHYEDMIENLPACVDKIAKFLDIGADDAPLKELVAYQASKEFMTAHISKFNDRYIKRCRNPACGLPESAGMMNPKVMSGPALRLAQATLEVLNQKWQMIVQPITGCDSYENFRLTVNTELRRKCSSER